MQSSDAQILAVVEEARQAWPELGLAAEGFVPYLLERLPADVPRTKALAAVHAPDLFVAWACMRGDPQALQLLEARFLQPAGETISRVDPTPDFAAEVLQRLRQKLLVPDGQTRPRLAGYSGRGSLLGWLRAAVMRAALNYQRDLRFAAGAGEPRSDEYALGADPELANIQTQHQRLFKEALAAALAELSVRERTLLRLHLVEGVGIDRLSPVFGVHRATVARWIAQAKEVLQAETRRLLAQRAALGSDELTSFFRALGSGFELSLSRLLAAKPSDSDEPPA